MEYFIKINNSDEDYTFVVYHRKCHDEVVLCTNDKNVVKAFLENV